MLRLFVSAAVFSLFAVFTVQLTVQFSSAQNAVPAAPAAKADVLLPPSLDDAKNITDVKQFLAAAEEKIKLEFTESAKKIEPTPAVAAGFIKRQGEHFSAAGEKILKLAETDADRELGYSLKIQGFKQLAQQERFIALDKLRTENKLDEKDPQYREKMAPLFLKVQQSETSVQKELDALIAEIEREGKFKNIIEREKFERFANKVMTCRTSFSPELFEQLKTEAKEWTAKPLQGLQPERPLFMLIGIAEADASRNSGSRLILKTIDEITAFVNSPQCTFTPEKKKQVSTLLNGYAKTCIGGNLALYGKTLDGKDFDWTSLRGKVALVLFTADWCVPCRDELPALRSVYDKYKTKGFEIVSVYIGEKKDGDVQRFVSEEKLPWLVISETLTKKSGKPEQGEEYMISQVPTMFLVTKDGRTLEQIPTAGVLNTKLAELLGQ